MELEMFRLGICGLLFLIECCPIMDADEGEAENFKY